MPKYQKNQISLQETYKHYKKCSESPVSYKEHKEILELWGTEVANSLVEGKDVVLPRGMSTLCVRKKKQPTYVDRVESSKQGKRVLGSNAHSGFYVAKVHWRTHYAQICTRKWSFKAARKVTSKINTIMKTPGGHSTYLKRVKVLREPTLKT